MIYLLCGLLWFVGMNLYNDIKRKTKGVSEVDSIIEESGILEASKKQRNLLLGIGIFANIFLWPISIGIYVWSVYLKK